MRKALVCLAAIAALPLSIAASPAHASVTVNDQGVGFVDRSDVQAVLGKLPSSVTFTLHTSSDLVRTELCADGSSAVFTAHSSSNYIVTSIANTNKPGKFTNGWNLTGLIGAGSVGEAGGGCYPQTVVSVVGEVTSGTSELAVNGVALPITSG